MKKQLLTLLCALSLGMSACAGASQNPPPKKETTKEETYLINDDHEKLKQKERFLLEKH